MNRHKTVKKSLILLVAVLMCVAVFLAACGEKPFKPNFTAPTGGKVDSNGGIAVQYGEWIYYVNGYESSASATNTYVDTNAAPRVGSVVRIKAADIQGILDINDDDKLSSSEKTKAIAKAVAEKTEIVVPNIYYSANTTNAAINGIYIFQDRLYILTPNDRLTAGGSTQTNQSVLMSYDLAGGNPQRHFTFSNNNAQVWLYEKAGKVMATYFMNGKLFVLEVANDEKSVSTEITGEEETISEVKYDEAGNCLFFIDGDGSVCKLTLGDKEKKVIINNKLEGDEKSTKKYTIKSVNNGYVYYTVADTDNSDLDNVVLYYINTNTDGEPQVSLDTADVTANGWKDGKVVVVRQTSNGYYGLYLLTQQDGKNPTCLLLPGYNESSIEIWKIVGDDLYYSAGGVMYRKDLSAIESEEKYEERFGEAYATSSISSTSTWALPDRIVVGDSIYVFSFGTGSVSVVKFDPEKKSDSASTLFTKTVVED